MTEEIIIDGVDVAGCFYFIDHTPPKGQGDWCGAIHKGACKVYSKDCEYNKDCYYKQLKRLEQEYNTICYNLRLTEKERDELKEALAKKIIIPDYVKMNEQIDELKQENKELKEEKSKLLDKSIEKQCRINDLLKKCSIKEFSLIVNGKKYSGLNGIDKAKLFINNENAVRDKYIKKLESEIFDTQWKFADAHKEIYKYRSALEEIQEEIKEDLTCESRECGCDDYGECLNCLKETILNKINDAL